MVHKPSFISYPKLKSVKRYLTKMMLHGNMCNFKSVDFIFTRALLKSPAYKYHNRLSYYNKKVNKKSNTIKEETSETQSSFSDNQ